MAECGFGILEEKMIHLVCSVHDSKAAAYLPPFLLPRSEMAVRTFSDCINSKDHQFSKHPADYTLFRLGMFDDEKGEFHLEIAPISEGNGVDFVDLSATAGLVPGVPVNAVQQNEASAFSDDASILEGATGADSPE